VFLTSRKFLAAEGGFKRLVWMPKELKDQLRSDLEKRFEEQEIADFFDKIADETCATSADDVRAFMEKTNHPALGLDDMSLYVQSEEQEQSTPKEKTPVKKQEQPQIATQTQDVTLSNVSGDQNVTFAETKDAEISTTQFGDQNLSMGDFGEIKRQITNEIKATLTKEIISSIIDSLSSKFLGTAPTQNAGTISHTSTPVFEVEVVKPKMQEQVVAAVKVLEPKVSAAERINAISSFEVHKESNENSIWTVKLGNTKEEGGTRGKTYNVGGSTCMPFHLWEGVMPNRPLVAMEVYDKVSEKYPQALRDIYKDLLNDPAAMAKVCVDKYGADLISVRLDATHPDRGDRTPQEAVDLVKSILKAVEVPLIITGHNNFEKNNEVMKAIASACEGENLLFNWVEQDNYRTIAGAAIAYGHTLVSQAPIDVNIGKQLNILLTNMDLKQEKIIMDPMTGSIGYGIEYTYSVMERIRLTGLGGDKMLCAPLIVSPGLECAKIKEFKATEENFPMWGDLAKRAAIWELSTATTLLYAGADILIMYHPEAVRVLKETISDLLDGQIKN